MTSFKICRKQDVVFADNAKVYDERCAAAMDNCKVDESVEREEAHPPMQL